MQIIDSLTNQGYSLSMDRDEVVVKYTGQGQPEPEIVRPLLAELKKNKKQAISYLTMAKMYRQASDELARLWRPGTRAWLEANQLGLALEIDEAETRLNAAWLAVEEGTADLSSLRAPLETWRQANYQAIRAKEE